MRVGFRVDASRRIGTGHVVRCLALAEALRARGAECRFVHRLHHGHMAGTIRDRGFEVQELPKPEESSESFVEADYAQWLGVSPERDARETAQALDGAPVDWLVVDHYALDADWERALRPRARRIAILDDLANRPHDCDLLVDQNHIPGAEIRYEGVVPDNACRLCGPRYALLRPEYAEARRLIGPRRGPLSRVLLFYGGADVHNESARALRVLSRPEFLHLAVDLVIGANNPHRESLEEAARERPQTTVHGPREHLVDLMLEADLAVGAGGTTTWERCVLGLPSIVTAVAENQVPFNAALAVDGAVHYLGHDSQVSDDSLAAALRAYLNAPDSLAKLARTAWWVSDGLGTARIAEALKPTDADTLRLRSADAADKSLFFEWANDRTTRVHAHNPEPIPWAVHQGWFDERLRDPGTSMWVMMTPEGLPVGQARADMEGDEAVLSYGLDQAFRGRGWGTRLLELVAAAWREGGIDIPLVGEVRPGNEASRRAFLRAGFAEAPSRKTMGGGRFTDRPVRPQ